MTDPPSRLLRSVETARTKTALKTIAPGSGLGNTGRARAVKPSPSAAHRLGVAIAVVEHGDDGTVSRPTATVVYWVGAATPDNGFPYDLWYPSTI